MMLVQYAEKKPLSLPNHIERKEEQQILIDIFKLNSSNIRLTNYKLIYNALPTNYKFRNRYDKNCFMCERSLNEDSEHIFVKCERSIEFYEYVRHNYLHKKNLENSLVMLEFKRGVSREDYKALSCFVYSVWRVRNMCKHKEIDGNHMSNFREVFNKWFITLTNI